MDDPHAEYPRMLYKQGAGAGEHQHEGVKLHPGGVKGLGFKTVASLDEEREALEDGWSLTPALGAAPVSNDARDTKIAELERQLAEAQSKPRVGRPPKQQIEDQGSNEEPVHG